MHSHSHQCLAHLLIPIPVPPLLMHPLCWMGACLVQQLLSLARAADEVERLS
jgi:hypothetical protein